MKIELGIATLAFLAGMTLQSQQQADAPVWTDWGEDPMQNPEFLAAWTATAKPGAEHELLAKDAGEYDVDLVMYMGPESEGAPATATASSHMAIGGRVYIEEYHSEFMGMPVEGMLLMGFNNLTEEYWSIWLDNFSTWPSIARGEKDDQGIVNQVGSMRDLLTPAGRPYRHVSWHDEAGAMRAEMFDSLPDGSEYKVMEFTYKRK